MNENFSSSRDGLSENCLVTAMSAFSIFVRPYDILSFRRLRIITDCVWFFRTGGTRCVGSGEYLHDNGVLAGCHSNPSAILRHLPTTRHITDRSLQESEKGQSVHG